MASETRNGPQREDPNGKVRSVEEQARLIRDTLEMHRLSSDALVYRGLADPAGMLILEKAKIALRKRLPVTVHGFFSTTVNPTGEMVKDQGNVIMRIFIPKGARAMYIAPLSVHPEEFEMLLDHKTKFRVLGIDNGKEQTYIDMAVEP